MKTNNPFLSLSQLIGILFLLFCLIIPANAQKVKTYKIWVTLLNETKAKGKLYAANEHQLVVVGEGSNQIKIDPRNIEIIKIRRTGSGGRGAWIGALSGALTGGVAGYAGGDDEPGFFSWSAEDKAGIGAFVGAPLGMLIGVGIGLVKKRFVVNGDESAYRTHLPLLREYAPQSGLADPIGRGLKTPK